MPPEGATVVMDIPESELLEHEVLADGWEADGFRHAGFGYREFVVPARVVNRYDRSLYVECGNCCSQAHDGECEAGGVI